MSTKITIELGEEAQPLAGQLAAFNLNPVLCNYLEQDSIAVRRLIRAGIITPGESDRAYMRLMKRVTDVIKSECGNAKCSKVNVVTRPANPTS